MWLRSRSGSRVLESMPLRRSPDSSAPNEDLRAFAAIEPIDTHVHAFKSDPEFTDLIARLRLHLLDICVADNHGIYGELATELARAQGFVGSSQGHAKLCVTFDPYSFQQKGYGQNIIKQLRQAICRRRHRRENLEEHWNGNKNGGRPLRDARRSSLPADLSGHRRGK